MTYRGGLGRLLSEAIASMTRSMPLPGPSRPQVKMVGRAGRRTPLTSGSAAPCGMTMTL